MRQHPAREETRSITTNSSSILPLGGRAFYEGGGWKDGRLGQAYDLLAEVLDERGELRFDHPLLTEIEALDEQVPA